MAPNRETRAALGLKIQSLEFIRKRWSGSSLVIHVAGDIAAAMSWRSYSYTSQSISELLAIGSPTRWIFALVPYTSLVIAFGMGVCWSAGRKRAVRTTGILLVAYGIVSHVG
jgi:Protein of unknown function (DUF998)